MERYQISSLSVEGFRGINKKLTLDFPGGLVLVSGDNGVGKTSVLQAVEWCLFGSLPYLDAREFKREDAIVNAFHPNMKATVRLVLKAQERTIEIQRERKAQKSSTAGKSHLILKVNGKHFEGEEAEAEVAHVLSTSPEDFYTAVYLHQEAIRSLVAGPAEVRTAIIDRLLGVHYLKELIDALPTSHIKWKLREVKDEISSLETGKEQAGAIARQRLITKREELGRAGIQEDELNIKHVTEGVRGLMDGVQGIADEVGATLPAIMPPGEDLLSLRNTIDALRRQLDHVASQRNSVLTSLVDALSTLKPLEKEYSDILMRLATAPDEEALKTQIDRIEADIHSIDEALVDKRDHREILTRKLSLARALVSEADEIAAKIKDLQAKFGDMNRIKDRMESLAEEIKDKEEEIKRQSTYDRLLATALDYLNQFSQTICPVCKQSIDPKSVTLHLEEELSALTQGRVLQNLQAKLTALMESRKQYEGAAEELLGLERKLSEKISEIQAEKKELMDRGFRAEEPLIKWIEDELRHIDAELVKSQSRIDELQAERSRVLAQIQEVKSLRTRRDAIERQILQRIKVPEGLGLKEAVNRKIEEIDKRMDGLRKVEDKTKLLTSELERLNEILRYLEEEGYFEEREKALPEIEENLKKLEGKRKRLEDLEEALNDISSAIATVRETIVERTLSLLKEDINKYHNEILSHPYYSSLNIVPEKERGKPIFTLTAQGGDGKYFTYVQTRFSSAQLNTVALSIFLAISMRLPSRLGFIILDDPSQSMDTVHKKALARIMQEVSKDKQVIIATQDGELENIIKPIVALEHKITKWTPQEVVVETKAHQ